MLIHGNVLSKIPYRHFGMKKSPDPFPQYADNSLALESNQVGVLLMVRILAWFSSYNAKDMSSISNIVMYAVTHCDSMAANWITTIMPSTKRAASCLKVPYYLRLKSLVVVIPNEG